MWPQKDLVGAVFSGSLICFHLLFSWQDFPSLSLCLCLSLTHTLSLSPSIFSIWEPKIRLLNLNVRLPNIAVGFGNTWTITEFLVAVSTSLQYDNIFWNNGFHSNNELHPNPENELNAISTTPLPHRRYPSQFGQKHCNSYMSLWFSKNSQTKELLK